VTRLDGPGFKSRYGQNILFFSITSRPALRPTQTVIQLVPRFFPGEENGGGTKLTAHLYLLPRLRLSGTIPLIPVRAFTVWIRKKIYLSNQNVCWRLVTRMQDKIAIVVQRQ
jgi:hypothetical protein